MLIFLWTQDYPIVSNDLMYVDLPIIAPSICKKLLVNVTDLLPGMFCAGYLEGQRDACQVRIKAMISYRDTMNRKQNKEYNRTKGMIHLKKLIASFK